jgi:hypothetical protein
MGEAFGNGVFVGFLLGAFFMSVLGFLTGGF